MFCPRRCRCLPPHPKGAFHGKLLDVMQRWLEGLEPGALTVRAMLTMTFRRSQKPRRAPIPERIGTT